MFCKSHTVTLSKNKMSCKRKRQCLTVSDKIQILKDIDTGLKKKDVSLKYGIPPSSLSTILKNRINITTHAGELVPQRKRAKKCKFETVDEAMLKWVKIAREKNLPVSGVIIREKAQEFAKKLGCEDFQASTGWLDKFKRRHGIVQKTVSGESAEVNEDDCETWRETVLKPILHQYTPRNVFNADETGLFFKCLPDKTLTFKNEKCFGGKHSKERITVMVGANMDGSEKLKLLVIGKSKTPRCFRGIKSLEVDYDFNKKSWMTSKIFENFVLNLDRIMRNQHRKIALFIDNCPSHPKLMETKLSNVQLFFFPPNMTSKLQPMDQGVIKNIKVHYRKRILMKTLGAMEENRPLKNLISLRDCISELDKVWKNDVTSITISNCFKKAGFSKNVSNWEDEDDIAISDLKKRWEELKQKGMIDEGVDLVDYVTVDEDLQQSDLPSEDDIIEEVINKSEVNLEEDDEDDEVLVRKPSEKEVFAAFETIRRALHFEDGVSERQFNCLNECETFYENRTLFKRRVQSKITDFFP